MATFEGRKEGAPLNLGDCQEERMIKFAKQFLHDFVLADEIMAPPNTEESYAYIGTELEKAAADPDTNDYDVLIQLATDMLYRNEVMPEWLNKFAADVLAGRRQRPTKRGPDKYANYIRDYTLWRATQEVANRFGLQHYSHNELSQQPVTAAEIVGEAAGCNADVVIKAYQYFCRKSGEE